MKYIYLVVIHCIVNPPKPAVSIAICFILGIIASVIVWYWLKLRVNKKRMDCIEAFIRNEIEYNVEIISLLQCPKKPSEKGRNEQLLNSIKRDKEKYLTEYWSLLSSFWFFKRLNEFVWYKIWSSFYTDLARYTNLYLNNLEPNDELKELLSSLGEKLVGKDNHCSKKKSKKKYRVIRTYRQVKAMTKRKRKSKR